MANATLTAPSADITTPAHPNTKYRVAIRTIAVDNGWTFDQPDFSRDVFTRDGETLTVHHNHNNAITAAERQVNPDANVESLPSTRGKMFVVQEWLTGIEDTYDPKTGKGKRFIRLTPEQVKRFESGQGIAKIKGEPTVKAEATTPVKTPAPKPAPAKKPTPRSRKAGTKAAAHTDLESMGY